MKPSGGHVISFEGGEGSGKSTQARLLAQWLTDRHIPFILTREPGGCPAAEKIRALLVSGETDLDPVTELLLVNAGRVEHVRQVIVPALAAGKIVVCDRFVDSTFAYQGGGRGLSAGTVREWHERLLPGFYPDLTFFLRVDVVSGLRRSGGEQRNEDRFEKAGLAFHQRIAATFDDLANQEPERFRVLDGQQSIDKIHHQILSAVTMLLEG